MNPSTANETLKFQAGETYTVALQQLTGKPCTSRFSGDQLLFSLIPDAESPWLRMFVEPYVQDRIRAAGIAPGEYFQISKAESFAGNRRVVSMEVRKVGADTGQRAGAPPSLVVNQAVVHTVATHSIPPAPAPQPPPLPQIAAKPSHPVPPVNGQGENSAAILSRCYIQAIDIALASTAYAESKGLRITPAFEDIRALAATICINETGGRR
jgi:hypothetical protein